MIVVSDTSPLCYLILIDEIDLLPRIFGEIVIPRAVHDELADPGAPEEARTWVEEPPDWLEVREVTQTHGSLLLDLHPGEREVLELARELGADLVILDDQAARHRATEVGLRVIGLLGILDRAAREQLVDIPQAVRRLQKTTFRIAPALLHQLLLRHRDS